MSKVIIAIKNGKISSYVGGRIAEITDDGKDYISDGWVVSISGEKPAQIKCSWSKQMYSDRTDRYYRAFELEDGLLELRDIGGVLSARFCSDDLQDFMDGYGITSIRRADPNQVYPTLVVGSMQIVSDGSVSDHVSIGCGDPITCNRVTNATWALIDICDECSDYRQCVLYTLENPMDLNLSEVL